MFIDQLNYLGQNRLEQNAEGNEKLRISTNKLFNSI